MCLFDAYVEANGDRRSGSAFELLKLYASLFHEEALGVNVHDYLTHLLLNANTIKDGDEDSCTALLPGRCDISDAKVYRERLLEAAPDPIRTEPYRLRGKRV